MHRKRTEAGRLEDSSHIASSGHTLHQQRPSFRFSSLSCLEKLAWQSYCQKHRLSGSSTNNVVVTNLLRPTHATRIASTRSRGPALKDALPALPNWMRLSLHTPLDYLPRILDFGLGNTNWWF